MYELYLAHHGIKGQRWGIRRYQNPDGTLTEAGKKRYGDAVESTPRHKPSEARKKAREEEKARKFEEKRQQALKTGNATEVLKYKNFSTQKELQDAISRINTERTLKQLSDAELNSGKKFVDKVIDTTDTWRARGEKVATVWNFVAKIHNSLVDEDDAWQKIGEKSVAETKRERAEKKAKEAEATELSKMAIEAEILKDLNYDQLKKYASVYDKKELKKAINLLDAKKKKEAADKVVKEAKDKAERDAKEASEKRESAKKRDTVLSAYENGKINYIQYQQLIKNANSLENDELERLIKKMESSND